MIKKNKLNIAIIGLGNIGSYLYKYLKNNKEILSKKNNCIPNVIFVSAKNRNKKRYIKVSKKKSLKSAIDLGIAMQLTNISRDVVEDFKNNRSYIDQNFEEIKSTIKLADTFYDNSFYSIKDIPLSFRFSILVARRIYRKIGYKTLNKKSLEDYQNSGKIYVSNIEKVLETLFSIFDLIKLTLSYKRDDQIQHDHNLISEEIDLNERI